VKDENLARLKEAKELIEEKEYSEAMRLINKTLDDEPDLPQGLFLMGYILYETERLGLAQTVMKRALELDPKHSEPWNLYGRCFQEGHDLKKAEEAYTKAIAIDPRNGKAYANMGLIYLTRANPRRALQYLNKAIQIEPENPEALYNISLCNLMLHDWVNGFKNYDKVLGRVKDRKERVYKWPPEPRWQGQKNMSVVAYGEQGIGDEITFASCIPDLIKDSKQVIIDCDRRLEPLFKRSFPEAIVYGDRFTEDVSWINDHEIDARAAFGSLPQFYRKADEDFPGTPYLVADPERRIQWRALLDHLGTRPKIGIAWTGGVKATGKERRSLKLEQLLPILKLDADFVSLEYLDRDEEIAEFEDKHDITIHNWQRAVHASQDYDETASLVAELDLIIGVPTSVLHLAGAVGTPFIAMAPEWPSWMWAGPYLWAKENTIFRQKGSWENVIQKVSRHVKNIYRNGSKAAASL